MSGEQLKDKPPAKVSPPPKAKAVKPDAAVSNETMIYIGPNIRGAGLQHAHAFRNGLPKRFEELFEECPQLRSMFVPLSKASVALSDLKIEGSARQMTAKRVGEHFAKEA